MIKLTPPSHQFDHTIQLPVSKSENNRVLIIQAICKQPFDIPNQSNSTDTQILIDALTQIASDNSRFKEINAGDAGTSFRFLLAYLSTRAGEEFILDGSNRMQDRPCGPLVNALRRLGADIVYLQKQGYPPVRIKGRHLKGSETSLEGSVSSQFLSAIMLVAPTLSNDLIINVTGDMVSRPYVELTASIMQQFGISVAVEQERIVIRNGNYVACDYRCESDWTAASYWYSMLTLHGGRLSLLGLRQDSPQGDRSLTELFEQFGIKTDYTKDGVVITKSGETYTSKSFHQDFTRNPDLAQTFAVLCAGLGLRSHLTGLSTLKIKETNRLLALQNELHKLGVTTLISDEDFMAEPCGTLKKGVAVKTYNDHRMAMSFAPLALVTGSISVSDPDVVKKSYPEFWSDLDAVGFGIETLPE